MHFFIINKNYEYGGVDFTLGAARLDTLWRQDWTPVKTAIEDSMRKRKGLTDEA